MQIDVTLSDEDMATFVNELGHHIHDIKVKVQEAMAEAYFNITYNNIGEQSMFRAMTWAPLSPNYAKKVGRSHATLFVTGNLLNAIKLDNSSSVESVVSVSDSDCVYAVAHQYGYPPRNLPPRPYFPFDPMTGETTTYTLEQVQAAAEGALAQMIYKLS